MGTYNIQRSTYSTTAVTKITNKSLHLANAEKIYLNMEEDKMRILDDNKGKAGIYLITNKINKKHYVGKSSNLGKRLQIYFSEMYLKRKRAYKIENIILKKGHKNFSLTILEIVEKNNRELLARQEQFYINAFKPIYNVRKVVFLEKESSK